MVQFERKDREEEREKEKSQLSLYGFYDAIVLPLISTTEGQFSTLQWQWHSQLLQNFAIIGPTVSNTQAES